MGSTAKHTCSFTLLVIVQLPEHRGGKVEFFLRNHRYVKQGVVGPGFYVAIDYYVGVFVHENLKHEGGKKQIALIMKQSRIKT